MGGSIRLLPSFCVCVSLSLSTSTLLPPMTPSLARVALLRIPRAHCFFFSFLCCSDGPAEGSTMPQVARARTPTRTPASPHDAMMDAQPVRGLLTLDAF